MKREDDKRLRNRKRRIGHRFRDRIWSEQATPMLRGRDLQYELSDRTRGLDTGGIGVMHRLALQTGLVEEVDRRVTVLKVHLPYHESDHVVNIAYNALCGGTCLEDIEWRRRRSRDRVDVLGLINALGGKGIQVQGARGPGRRNVIR